MDRNVIDALIDDVLRNPDSPAEVSKEEIADFKKNANVYGVVIPGDEAWFNVSITNWRETYLRQLNTTAMIAFMFRMFSEYKVESECPSDLVLNPDFVFDNSLNKNNVNKNNDEEKTSSVNDVREMSNAVFQGAVKHEIKKFLERNFKFDPDRHLKSCYKDNLEDPERAGKFPKLREDMATQSSHLPHATPKSIREKLESVVDLISPHVSKEVLVSIEPVFTDVVKSTEGYLAATYNVAKTVQNAAKSLNGQLDHFAESNPFSNPEFGQAYNLFLNKPTEISSAQLAVLENGLAKYNKSVNGPTGPLNVEDFRPMLANAVHQMNETTTQLYPYVCKSIVGAVQWVPPVELFYNFDRFFTNHYELLREATLILYGTRPDLEYAIQIYGKSYPDYATATTARKKIEDKIITGVFTLSNEAWNILGPFKQNRDRVEFLNKNTGVLKQMFEQSEQDSKVGMELLKDKVSKAKAKNIAEAGPDDSGLAGYRSAIETINNLGGKPALSQEERDKLAAAHKTRTEAEMNQVPDDAIQVDVFKTDAEGRFMRDKFYTKAQAPEFMEDNIKAQKMAMDMISTGYSPAEAYKRAHAIIKNEPLDDIASTKRNVAETTVVKSRDGKIMTLKDLKDNIRPAN